MLDRIKILKHDRRLFSRFILPQASMLKQFSQRTIRVRIRTALGLLYDEAHAMVLLQSFKHKIRPYLQVHDYQPTEIRQSV